MRLKSVLALCRVSNLPTVWMNVVTASVLTSYATNTPADALITIAMALAVSCFYCAGMSLNDVCDFRWDQQHQTYRPIVAGKISLIQAKWITAILFSTGFGLMALAPNPLGLLAALVLFADIFGYNLLHKRHAASVLLMGAARALVFVVVGLGLAGTLSPWVILAAALQLLYTLSLTLVARHENKRGKPYSGPVIPRMIAAMAILDGTVLAIIVSPIWILLGVVMALLTRFGQRYVRGD
jgi:4-hydroxybenzoate polyprenyltransferase